MLNARQTILLVVLFVATSLGFIALDNRAALDPLKTGLREITVPITDAFNDLVENDPDTEIEQQLAQVEAERDALLADNARLRMENQEVEQLRELLRVQEERPGWTLVTARVVNPDPTNLQKFITIDKGSVDGIEKGMAVVTPSNVYVGQVTLVEEQSARVTLIIDQSAQVGAQLLDGGAVGIVYGAWQQGGRSEMRHVDRGTEAKEGGLILTASNPDVRTSRVPGGIVIGKVTGEPTVDNQTDSLTLNVLPVADFDNLKVVAVVVVDEDEGE
jgi:rod shape-determining protein MreC